MSDYMPNTDVIRQACTFERNRLGEPCTINVEAFERWLEAERARIWDEGFDAGHYVNDQESRDCDCRENPYRMEKQ